ncbi:MAG: hypothetical protein H6828_05870 [Planctomycetes bacterium]|nr:hypothetical protein [Planctomycetota bacterium]
MILVLERGTSQTEVDKILAELERRGLEGRALTCGEKNLIHVIAGRTRLARPLLRMDGVQGLVPTSGPRIRVQGRRFYPYHFIGWFAACLLVSGLLVLLAGFFPPGVGAGIDMSARPEVIAAPWYLRPFQGLMELFPANLLGIGWVAVLALVVAGFCLPFLDRTEGPGFAGRWPALLLGFGLIAGAVLFALGVAS